MQGDPGSTETLRVETTWRTPEGLVLGGLDFPYFGSQRRGHCRRGGSGKGSHQSGRRELRLASKEKVWASGRALEFGGVPDGEREGFDDGGLELVVLDLDLVEPLS